jgi:hypothetical protein
MVTTVLVGIAGPGLLLKPGGGLYWMIPAVPASLADGMITRGHPCSRCVADRILTCREPFRGISPRRNQPPSIEPNQRTHRSTC